MYMCTIMFLVMNIHVSITQASLQKAFDEIGANLASECQENASLKSTVSQMVADAAVVQCQLEAVKV